MINNGILRCKCGAHVKYVWQITKTHHHDYKLFKCEMGMDIVKTIHPVKSLLQIRLVILLHIRLILITNPAVITYPVDFYYKSS